MMRWLVCLTLLVLPSLLLPPGFGPRVPWLAAAQKDDDAADAERKIAERFAGVLEKNPRKGTALDRVYGFHVERGSLDAFVKNLQQRTAKNPKDGDAWMVLGLVEAQRGRDGAAVTALKQAEQYRPDDPLASYYLGQSLVLVGQPDAAAEAFERALTRKPGRADLLEIFQALGRVHQRAQRSEKALEVWGRLEKLFPDDLRVQEQIATTLAEEGQNEQALARYEALAKKTKDNYKQTNFRMEAAELKVRLGKGQQALVDLEELTNQLNPDSWLYREARRKIEEVFLRNDDQAGMAKYYEKWIGKNPEDVEAMARLARSLAIQGRTPEAQTWLEKALKLAPSRKELRLTLVEQLVADQKFGDAVKQYEALSKNDPNNPDYLREWGKLLLKDSARPLASRRKDAAAVWDKLLQAKPKDPVTVTQVADLFRQAEMSDEAVALYKKAVELAPDQPQYREYLGEYYHTLKKPDEALATWRPIAAGANRNAKNLARLAEVFGGFGYLKEAVDVAKDALSLEADNFNLVLKYADLLHQVERYDDALAQLDTAGKLVSNEEEAEAVLQQQIKNYQATDTLDKQIEGLKKELDGGKDATAKRWHRLARLHEAAREMPEATAAITKVLQLDEKWTPGWAAAARIHESAGSLLLAADANRRLAAIDRRFRSEYLTNVAKLESRLGRKAEALQAGRDLLAASPGNPETYKFYADLCFGLDENEEGLDALRRSVRVNPSDPQGILTLSAALAERFRTDEAVELYWRAFEKAADMEARLGVVQRLAELYLQSNHFERLLERLERERREGDRNREMTLCIAQAYTSAGDFGTARQQLERLLSENTRDTQLLQQLSTLAENEGDLGSAVKYQRQLVKAAPNREAEGRLATLLMRAGENEEARAIWVRHSGSEQEHHKLLQTIDTLTGHGQYETALAVTERLLRDKPHDWEVLFREGTALSLLDKREQANQRFKTILDLKLADDDKSAIIKAREKEKPGRLAATTSRAQQQYMQPQYSPLFMRANNVWQVRAAAGLDERERYYAGGMQQSWAPVDYGQARMVALGRMLVQAQKDQKEGEFVKTLKTQAQAAGTPGLERARWDRLYLEILRQNQRDVYDAAREVAKGTDPAGKWAYLNWLASRTTGQDPRVVRRGGGSGEQVDNTPPLPAAELDQVLQAYRIVRKQKPEWLMSNVVTNVLQELKRAKRPDDEQQIYRDAVDAANKPETVRQVLDLAADRGDVEGTLRLLDKLEQMTANRLSYTRAMPLQAVTTSLAKAMFNRGKEKAYADVLRLFDRYLAAAVRYKKATAGTRQPSQAAQNYGQPYLYYTGSSYQRYMQIDFPSPNEYYDSGSITLLRQAHDIYRKADLASDLTGYFRTQLAKTPPADRVWVHLALGYLSWWNDDKEQALQEMTRACDIVPGDQGLRFDLVGAYEKNNDPEEALTALETITPTDHTTMQKKENTALRLAVRTGNVERARQAADRLFGLRLDSETQVQLAAQMRQLGMHTHAEAVMARARRQAGNRGAALVSLLMQYQAQGQLDTAVEVAHQILRKGTATPGQQFQRRPNQGSGDEGRDQAIQVLARSGKLKELIERAETQLKNSPKSVQLHQVLADYYRAAGERGKMKEVYLKMAELRPDDAKMRYQVANYLVAAGDIPAALDHFLAAFKKEPALYMSNYWQIQNYFKQANREEELTRFFEEVDLKKLSANYWSVMEFVQSLLQDNKTQARGMRLFKKAWDAYPQQRNYLISNLYREEIWRLPEMYDYMRQAVIPAGDTLADPWESVNHIYSYSGEGRATGVVNRLLEGAAKQNKTEQLTKEIEEAVKKHPDWNGGKAILAILQVRAGKTEEAKKALAPLIDDKKNPMPSNARWVIGQELENYSACKDLVLAIYEGTLKDAEDDINLQFEYSPLRRLVTIYQKSGRVEDARAMMLKFARSDRTYEYDPGYSAYRKVQELNSIGGLLLQLGYPIDAVKVYNDLLSDQNRLEALRQWYGGQDYMQQQAQQGLLQALQGMKPDLLAKAARDLVSPKVDPKSSAPALDLLILVPDRSLNTASMVGMFASTVKAAAAQPDVRTEMKTKLDALLAQRPRDLSVHMALALAALADDKPDAALPVVERLVKLVEETPLEAIPAGTRANARQRADAAAQLGLWLVARDCQKHDALRSLGDKLAARALEAARRQTDKVYALSILREFGQQALDRGDRATAEKRWTEMLDAVLTDPTKKAKPAQPTPAVPVSPAPQKALPARKTTTANGRGVDVAFAGKYVAQLKIVPPSPAAPGAVPALPPVKLPLTPATSQTPERGTLVPVVTVEQFNQAADIARLAADHDMPALSLRAIEKALRGGPPITVANENLRGRVMYVNGTTQEEMTGPNVQVVQRLQSLEPIWKRKKVPAADVYRLLLGAVIPDARPGEIFLYPQPLVQNVQQPFSVGALLARWAVQAGQTDALRKRIATRQALPLAEMPAKALFGLLGLACKDAKLTAENLAWFADRLQKDQLRNTCDLGCHVAVPALRQKELSPSALTVLERVAKALATQQGEEPVGSLLLMLARFHFDKGRPAEAGKQVHEYLRVVEQQNVRYGGDYGLYLRKQQLFKAATEFARANQLKETLDLFGQAVDVPRYQWGDPSVGNLAALVARQLTDLPGAERYETLKTWTLPTATRKSVRLVGSFVPDDVPPAAFGKFRPVAPPGGVVSSAQLLLDAAREAGKLDELAGLMQKAAETKVENADALLVLTQLARGEGDKAGEQVKRFADELKKKLTTATDRYGRQKPVDWSDYLVCRACLADPKQNATGEAMARDLLRLTQTTQAHVFITHLRRDLAASVAAREGGTALGPDAGLALWHAGHTENPDVHKTGTVAPVWLAHDGMIAHVAGSWLDYLFFDYPLSGTFEFTAEAFAGSWAEGVAGYGGFVFEPFWMGMNSITLWPVSEADKVNRPFQEMRPDQFNRITIQVQPGKIRYLANGRLQYEDDEASPTSPWLTLFTRRERHTLWRNLEIRGLPEIPREVKLTHADRLDGWVSNFYGETMPPRLSLKEKPKPPEDSRGRRVQPETPPVKLAPEDYDWHSRDGVVRGKRFEGTAAEPMPSRLYYFRPLRDGETIRYEFFYEPDNVMAHPALDRLAFLLEPDGVRLHWMTDGADEWTGLKMDNVADEPGSRRGPSRLPLQAGDWNAVKVTLAGKAVALELNGVEIYRRDLEHANDRTFGFFRYKDRTAAQLRNVVLTGSWPDKLTAEQLANLTARAAPDAVVDRRARAAVIGEEFFVRGVSDVLRRARALASEKRYEYLAAWVLPGDDHRCFRLYGEFTTDKNDNSVLESPALELIVTAHQTKKLDDLAGRIQGVKAEGDSDRRNQLALLACVRMVQDNFGAANDLLKQLQPLLAKVGNDVAARERWPEFLVANVAIDRQPTRAAGMNLLDFMVVEQIQKMKWEEQNAILGTTWMQQTRHARARGQVLNLPNQPPFGTDPKLVYWTPVVHERAATHGGRYPKAHWTVQNDALIHYPGNENDFAYFRVPIRGDFELSCELTSFGWREAQLLYGGRIVALHWELDKYEVQHFSRNLFSGSVTPKIANLGEWYEYKLVVAKGTMTSYVNGRRIHEEPSPADRDPWLAVRVKNYLTGGIRKVKITSTATVPESIDLTKADDLTGWLGDFYDGQGTGENAAWEKRGEEVYGRSYPETELKAQESVLQYHRPLLEDGTVDYEFFYVPDRTLAHPALGRFAFLLRPDGVRLHRLTDARYEHADLPPDNAVLEKDSRRGPDRMPLKAGEWNRMRLTVVGNKLTLRLNDVEIYERELDAAGTRFFSLFHYMDETDVRVRNVTYRGTWPKQLPAADAMFVPKK